MAVQISAKCGRFFGGVVAGVGAGQVLSVLRRARSASRPKSRWAAVRGRLILREMPKRKVSWRGGRKRHRLGELMVREVYARQGGEGPARVLQLAGPEPDCRAMVELRQSLGPACAPANDSPVRVGRGGLDAVPPGRGRYALARVFPGVTLAAPADGARMLLCPSSQRTRTRGGSS